MCRRMPLPGQPQDTSNCDLGHVPASTRALWEKTENGQEVHHIELAQEVSFFNKASVMNVLDAIPANSKVIIDCSMSKSIAYDVIELIKNYEINAKTKNITVEKINFIAP